MHTIRTQTGASFTQADGQTILEAGMSGGTALAYSCRTGRCSTCKCKVLSGSSAALHEELGLSAEESKQGWILSCVRSASSDMEIEAEDLGGISLPPVRTVPCRISNLERLAPDVLKVTLRLPPSNAFEYLPGQYVEVIGPGGIRRSYSLANAQPLNHQLELHIRQVPGGAMSAYWFNDAAANALLRLNGPHGSFFLRDPTDLDLIFLATGTGIAPVKAMLETLAKAPKPARSVTVYWGGRVADDLYWDAGSVAATHRHVPVLSRADAGWTGARGYVQQVLLEQQPDLSQAMVYACGSDAMIHSAHQDLCAAGLPERRFLSDAFVCSASA